MKTTMPNGLTLRTAQCSCAKDCQQARERSGLLQKNPDLKRFLEYGIATEIPGLEFVRREIISSGQKLMVKLVARGQSVEGNFKQNGMSAEKERLSKAG
jgi:hypothetical protein